MDLEEGGESAEGLVNLPKIGLGQSAPPSPPLPQAPTMSNLKVIYKIR